LDYITCNQKKNKSRVSIAVCERCRRRKGCSDYGNYLQPPLFPGIRKFKPKKPIYRAIDKSKMVKPHVNDLLIKDKQLALNL
jgi:hypothetical protein